MVISSISILTDLITFLFEQIKQRPDLFAAVLTAIIPLLNLAHWFTQDRLRYKAGQSESDLKKITIKGTASGKSLEINLENMSDDEVKKTVQNLRDLAS